MRDGQEEEEESARVLVGQRGRRINSASSSIGVSDSINGIVGRDRTRGFDEEEVVDEKEEVLDDLLDGPGTLPLVWKRRTGPTSTSSSLQEGVGFDQVGVAHLRTVLGGTQGRDYRAAVPSSRKGDRGGGENENAFPSTRD